MYVHRIKKRLLSLSIRQTLKRFDPVYLKKKKLKNLSLNQFFS